VHRSKKQQLMSEKGHQRRSDDVRSKSAYPLTPDVDATRHLIRGGKACRKSRDAARRHDGTFLQFSNLGYPMRSDGRAAAAQICRCLIRPRLG
jgi:hypothetical protein